MVDRGRIEKAAQDIIKAAPMEYGKIEIDFDARKDQFKVQLHSFNKCGERVIRTTKTIKSP
jgi:hypothetical protein